MVIGSELVSSLRRRRLNETDGCLCGQTDRQTLTCIIICRSPWRPPPRPCAAPRTAPSWAAASADRWRCAWTSACWTPGYLQTGAALPVGRVCSLSVRHLWEPLRCSVSVQVQVCSPVLWAQGSGSWWCQVRMQRWYSGRGSSFTSHDSWKSRSCT